MVVVAWRPPVLASEVALQGGEEDSVSMQVECVKLLLQNNQAKMLRCGSLTQTYASIASHLHLCSP